jgi:hypothetical protein
MIRLASLASILALLSASAHADPAPTSILFSTPPMANRLLTPSSTAPAGHALTCCKVCSVGKACGNTCIAREKTCHVGQGCACDG